MRASGGGGGGGEVGTDVTRDTTQGTIVDSVQVILLSYTEYVHFVLCANIYACKVETKVHNKYADKKERNDTVPDRP